MPPTQPCWQLSGTTVMYSSCSDFPSLQTRVRVGGTVPQATSKMTMQLFAQRKLVKMHKQDMRVITARKGSPWLSMR